MRDKKANEQIPKKNVKDAPAHHGSWRKPGFDPNVKDELKSHAGRQQPSIEIARIPQTAFVEFCEPEENGGKTSDRDDGKNRPRQNTSRSEAAGLRLCLER
jgi:hypothetical protein